MERVNIRGLTELIILGIDTFIYILLNLFISTKFLLSNWFDDRKHKQGDHIFYETGRNYSGYRNTFIYFIKQD